MMNKKYIGILVFAMLFGQSIIAQSNLLNAENELLITKKNFKNVIGYDPVDLEEINNLKKLKGKIPTKYIDMK